MTRTRTSNIRILNSVLYSTETNVGKCADLGLYRTKDPPVVIPMTTVNILFKFIHRFTGPGCMSTNTIIVTCNAVLSLLATFLTLLPCTKKTTGGVVPAALQAAIGK